MDHAIRESLRAGDALRTAVLLQRAGRLDEALDAFEGLWRAGGEEQEAAGDGLLTTFLELPEERRLSHAGRLEGLARDELEGARSLWLAWFAPASNVVGESASARAQRAFLYERAAARGPALLVGEAGTGHTLSARTLHALTGGTAFHEAYAPSGRRRLQPDLEGLPPRSTVFLSYANQVERWAEWLPAACRARELRLVVGMNVSVAPRLVLEGEPVPACELSPLRERLDDIPHLVRELLRRAGADEAADALPPRILEDLARHDWPGNVRELANHVARAVRRARRPDEIPRHLMEDLYGLPGEVA
ncbi:MAG: hypothetical protein AB7N76_31230 [Planctomycetota bacterium]